MASMMSIGPHDHRVDQAAEEAGDRTEHEPIDSPIATETTPISSE